MILPVPDADAVEAIAVLKPWEPAPCRVEAVAAAWSFTATPFVVAPRLAIATRPGGPAGLGEAIRSAAAEALLPAVTSAKPAEDVRAFLCFFRGEPCSRLTCLTRVCRWAKASSQPGSSQRNRFRPPYSWDKFCNEVADGHECETAIEGQLSDRAVERRYKRRSSPRTHVRRDTFETTTVFSRHLKPVVDDDYRHTATHGRNVILAARKGEENLRTSSHVYLSSPVARPTADTHLSMCRSAVNVEVPLFCERLPTPRHAAQVRADKPSIAGSSVSRLVLLHLVFSIEAEVTHAAPEFGAGQHRTHGQIKLGLTLVESQLHVTTKACEVTVVFVI